MATRNRRALRAAASSAALLAFLTLFTGLLSGGATAKPRPSLHKVSQQVETLNKQAGEAAERYNTARLRYTATTRRLTVVAHRASAMQAKVDAMQSSVGSLANAAYKSGGVDPTLQILFSRNPQAFLRSAVAVNQLSRQQAAMLASVVAARQALKAARTDVAEQRIRAAAVADQVKADKASIVGKLDAAKALLSTLQADQRATYFAARNQATEHNRDVASRSRDGDPPNYDGPASGRVSVAIKTAFAQLGDAYSYGAAGPSAFDCSGLTMFAWGSAGVSLPHSSSAQYASLPHVAISDLQPGDLVFYYSPISHVAIYIGGGRIIHAPHPGRSVEVASLHLMPLVGAARP